MEPALHLIVNGVPRTLDGLVSPTPLSSVLECLEMRPDRVAVELNSEIAPRAQWGELTIKDGDRVEIVHFVGGGRH
jgi:thiamine biosynthesis protein ThiS